MIRWVMVLSMILTAGAVQAEPSTITDYMRQHGILPVIEP